MKDNKICVIGGFDNLAQEFFLETLKHNSNSIFINLDTDINIKKKNVYHFKIFQLKRILSVLKLKKIKNIVFLGKIKRPNISDFKKDGLIENYLSLLINSYQKGDGSILATVINIFKKNGYTVVSPKKVSNKFFFSKSEIDTIRSDNDKKDIVKSVKLLNDLSKHDNAQAVICVNEYIIGIEAAEGTDNLIKRSKLTRKKLNQLQFKAGLLTKIPKKNQSTLIDLPVVGPKTINLIKSANLSGIAINSKFTMVFNKQKVISLARKHDLKIYEI